MNLTTVKDIIGYFVGKISTEIKVDNYEAATGGYKVFTCNTKWAMLYFNVEIRVLNEQTNEYEYVDAEISEVDFNKYFVIKTVTEPILGIRLKPLHFRSGTILQTREELSADPNFASPYERTPMIFVREIAGEERQSKYSNQIERRLLEIPEIFFLAPCGKADRTNVAYEDVIYPMLNVVRLFENVLYTERRIVSRFNSFEVKYHTKFAVNTRQGNTEWVFDEALAGAELNINIGLLVDAYNDCKCNEAIVPTNPCLNAQISINEVSFSTVESGGELNIIVEDTDGLEVGSKVGNKWVVPKGEICDPATYVLKNSLNVTLETGTINSGASADIVAPNGVVTVTDSAASNLYVVSVVSNGAVTQAIGDSTANLVDSANAPISTTLLKAQETKAITAPDGTVNVRDSAGVLIEAKTVKSNGTETATVADSSITNDATTPTYTQLVKATEGLVLPTQSIEVNDVVEGSINSVGTIDINITDGVNPVVPDSVGISGRTVTIAVPSGGGSPSGVAFNFVPPEQNTSYGDFDIGWRRQNGWFDDHVNPPFPEVIAELDYTSANYHFLLKNALKVRTNSTVRRFVDIDGLQEFPATNNKDKVIIDKYTSLAAYRDPHSLGTFANRQAALDFAQTLNINVDGVIFNDWYMVGYCELLAIMGNFLVPRGGTGNNSDPITSKVIFTGPTANHNVQTAFTNIIFGGTNILGYRALATISYQATGGADYAFFIHKAKHLITAP